MRVDTVSSGELGPSRLHWFESPAEFASAADRLEQKYEDRSWTGETWELSIRRAIHGRADLVREAEAAVESVRRRIPSPRSVWAPSVAGAYPVVPEAISGVPEPMRRRVRAYASNAPVRLFVDLVSSAGVNHDQLARRGAAALALVMALSDERAVELHAVVGLGCSSSRCVCVIKLQTAPLDLASVCHALTSAGFARNLGYSLCWDAANKPEPRRRYDWMFGYFPSGDARAAYVRQLKAIVGASEADVVVPPAFLGDETDPVAFVLRGLAEHDAQLGETAR